MILAVSIRGFQEHPKILLMDTDSGKVENEWVYKKLPKHVPNGKRGFTGLQFKNEKLYAATWDRIIAFDTDGTVADEITSPQFSDLHGIYIDDKNTIWSANTNLESVFENDHFFWSPNPNISINDQDYSTLTKDQIPWHQLHINSIWKSEQHLFVTYLGTAHQKKRGETLLTKAGISKRRYMDGGIFIVDSQTKKITKHLQTEGLHDPFFYNGKLYFTAYFGNCLYALDTNSFKLTIISLQQPPFTLSGQLLRGLGIYNDVFYTGTTAYRSSKNSPHKTGCFIKAFDQKGRFLKDIVQLDDYIGVYQLVAIE